MNATTSKPGTGAAPALPVEGDVLLRVSDLHAHLVLRSGRTVIRAVNGVSLTLRRGETMAIIGESGCGKSMLCSAIMQILPKGARIMSGSIRLDGEELVNAGEARVRHLRGDRMSMILQDPLVALDPLFRIGDQVAEPLRNHRALSRATIREKVVGLLRQMQISAPERRVTQYPHQLSGGMLQRVVGATAISCGPSLLIADEPTTALDPTVQAQFLDLLDDMRTAQGLSLIIVTHDLGVAARIADRIVVMYAGRVVESGPKREVLRSPAHPYTRALLDSVPGAARRGDRLRTIEGQPPDLSVQAAGCAFAARCPSAMPRCRTEEPPEVALSDTRQSRCWLEALE